MKWKIEYDNETGPGDEGFLELWAVTDGIRRFKCNSEDDAKWLTETLNAIEPQQIMTNSTSITEKFPSCTTCIHYRKPTIFVWEKHWWLLLIPIVGWAMALTISIGNTPWCVAGQSLSGELLDDGSSCHKMRCFGSCGAEGKLYEPKNNS